MLTLPSHAAGRRVLAAASLAALLLAAGCAAPQRPRLSYPPPPDTARIVHLRSFSRPDDLQTSGWQRFLNALVPHDSALAILNPAGLALSPDERLLYVASPPRGRVLAVDLASGRFSAIGITGQRRLGNPIGVATDATGLLYVSDKQANAILVYQPDGTLLRTFGAELLNQPTGLALDRRGQQLYVINDATSQTGRNTVEVFALDGRHLRTMGGGRGPAPGTFYFPSDLAVNAAGQLYVSDMLNFRVQVFDDRGGLLKFFGAPGSGNTGLFDKIHGISFDTFGNVYVVDLMQGIQVLNDLNQPLLTFGQGVAGSPLGIVIDSHNHIFVSDFQHAVHEFELVNTTAQDSHPAAPGASGPKEPARP